MNLRSIFGAGGLAFFCLTAHSAVEQSFIEEFNGENTPASWVAWNATHQQNFGVSTDGHLILHRTSGEASNEGWIPALFRNHIRSRCGYDGENRFFLSSGAGEKRINTGMRFDGRG